MHCCSILPSLAFIRREKGFLQSVVENAFPDRNEIYISRSGFVGKEATQSFEILTGEEACRGHVSDNTPRSR